MKCHARVMQLQDLPVVDVRPQLVEERAALLQLLEVLSPNEWSVMTAAEGWDVKAVVLHLLDDDLGWLSRGRDSDSSGELDMSDYATFVQALAAKNQRWIDGARGLSSRLLVELLRWSGEQVDAYYSLIPLGGTGGVIWASDGGVPQWFDIAQDLTERWVHQMQIREAVGRVEQYSNDYVGVVLKTFVWALPHHVHVEAITGTAINVDFGIDQTWHLVARDSGEWSLETGLAKSPAASVTTDADTAWRLLTGAQYDKSAIARNGRNYLVEAVLASRGIIV